MGAWEDGQERNAGASECQEKLKRANEKLERERIVSDTLRESLRIVTRQDEHPAGRHLRVVNEN